MGVAKAKPEPLKSVNSGMEEPNNFLYKNSGNDVMDAIESMIQSRKKD